MTGGALKRLKRIAAALLFCTACGIHAAQADDWEVISDALTKAGVTPVLSYEGDMATNTSGGVKQGSVYSDILHMQFSFDGGRLADMPGLSGYLDGMWINGGQISKLVGDTQGVSSVAGPDAVRLYEAWLQYNFLDNRLSILGGRYDLGTEFDRLATASLFLNTSFGTSAEFGHSGFAGPSVFPDTSLAVRVAYKPSPNTVLRAAVLDGAPLDPMEGAPNPFNPHTGLLFVAEAAFLTRPSAVDIPYERRFRIGRRGTPTPYDDKIAIGAWYYTADFEEPGPTGPGGVPLRHNGESGAYVAIDRLLLRSSKDPAQRLTGFVQLGVADQIVDRTGTYIGAGLVATGFVPGRPDDEFGLAMAMARNGSAYIGGQEQAGLPVSAAETAIELSYLTQIESWLALQPDAQYVIHPNTDPRLHDATVVQLRFELSF
jgi:porin